ncbi:MAG TPA: tripartite tricarboxylate transporter substrate binding protein [Ottowia sp.]|jgi:tripartite-type tricarboxylate transporter receptor subunit TctC|uniref:Bug family tripartite tricarboxylate transporter substrate binding protein n=1 Tax=Ottowia sp. TaxID=1898956 RepID=UPI001B4CC20E|nr:tripartite tricarboxylate transporter substrate binding protein [Ottowia sp.]MBP7459450.1 tripartite tricarboxylate transporter substrate binding protein [Ottowia sp.]MBP8861884.1 tripartite tricarboxylate transporter substrate binding protein [Ottowia sp.]MBP8896417.1 tripartite tricarboxylate transporter substrate binding protein [Ottowia sp.]HOP89310.1 tripartite tricarboxylate transporter substrate binding protein [Ottowia sp.]HRM52983.1 tripartite tricarboxylate transporter substrate b
MPHAERFPFTRRTALQLAALALASVAGAAHAQAWPSKPVSLVVPFPAGGTTDVLARALAERLSPAIGQPVIVENKPGAGATIGADYVAKAKADGHTLLIGAVHHTIASSVYKKLPYDFQKGFEPVTVIAMVPNVLVVNARTPAKNVNELVALIKAKPAEASYGSNGNGTAQHLIGTQFQQQTGTRLQHIPYKGSGPLATDLLGGQILMSFDTITPVLPHIKAGKLRPLAVTTAKRSPALPDVPTLQEAGLKDFDIGTWFGVLAPVGTPKPVLDRLSAEATKIIQSPDFRKRMDDIGAQPVGNSPAEMAAQIRSETDKFSLLVKAGNVTVE